MTISGANSHQGQVDAANNAGTFTPYRDSRSSEQIICDAIKADLGVTIDPMAWRMFLRLRWDVIHGPAHRIHEGKR